MQQSSVVKKYLLLSGLLLILIANIAYGEESLFVYSEIFSTDTYKDAAKTTADWNLQRQLLQLSKDHAGNTKQVKGDVVILGAFQYYCWIDFRGGLGDNNGHVYMQKFNTAGVKQWSEDRRVNTDNSLAVQRNQKVCLEAMLTRDDQGFESAFSNVFCYRQD